MLLLFLLVCPLRVSFCFYCVSLFSVSSVVSSFVLTCVFVRVVVSYVGSVVACVVCVLRVLSSCVDYVSYSCMFISTVCLLCCFVCVGWPCVVCMLRVCSRSSFSFLNPCYYCSVFSFVVISRLLLCRSVSMF